MASEFPNDTPGAAPPPPPPPGLPPAGHSMIDRVKRIVMSPRTEWPAIEAEPMTLNSIMIGWVLPLAAIGPIAGLIRNILFPLTLFGVSFRPSLAGAVVQAALAIGLTMLGVWVWSLVLDALAPNFKGTKNPIAALKLVAFSATAAWLCGIFQLTWATAPLAILGLYSAYLFWVGVPVTMKVPDDQRPVYVVVAVVVGIVVNLVVGAVAAALAGMMFAMTPGASLTTPGGAISVGGATIDTGKLEAQAAAIKASTEKMQASLAGKSDGVKAVDPAALQNLLPASIAGWNRTSIESQGAGAAGINGSNAKAQFQAGDQSFSLSITDMGALGNIATLGGAVNASSSKQTATGYEKTEMQGGNMVSERWDNQSRSGSYSVMVASRFAVEAEGSAPSIDVLKNAVGAISLGQIQALAK
ncbi:MAG: YIP1 family protein [Proteobacteria bacterium]|nr:YIP1 family protein [Pseudomonadota bacterium]